MGPQKYQDNKKQETQEKHIQEMRKINICLPNLCVTFATREYVKGKLT